MSNDVQSLPDVKGLEAFVRSTSPDIAQDKGQERPRDAEGKFVKQQAQSTETPTAEQTQQPPAEKPLDLKQFKTPEALLKAYGEVQGAFTKVSQENKTFQEREKAMQDQLKAMQEQVEMIMLQGQRQAPMPPQQPEQNFDEMFIQNPRQAVEVLADRKASEKVMQARVIEVLEEEQIKNPTEFNERYAYAQALSRQYPNLVTSAAGVRKLFQIADKVRVDETKKNATRAVNQLFGAGAMEWLSAFLAQQNVTVSDSNTNQPNLAYMPDSGGNVSRPGSEPANVNFDLKIQEAAGKGDVDSVLKNLFQRTMRTP